ncbi:CHAD domain-containing protein [Deinococcus arcticus]|uniref:CHAD domain-containing protein n=1 Tax=Deinococcus arcticus TaxID=2136176 RepID=A0A2T3W411_9DEIO|nr:CHAD domain-containing protein [Deinococcus arcticus]PTA66640.1 hypothetical protein C8263_16870 [Deinococcus arcticus]
MFRKPYQAQDTGPWHEWRKHLKRYRFTAELTGDAPQAVLDVLEELGRLQDAQVAQDLLRAENWVPGHRDALLRREAGAQQQAQARACASCGRP